MKFMDLHNHHDTIESASQAHPKLGLLFVILTPIFGVIAIFTEPSSLEHTLTIANLIGSLFAKFMMLCSFVATLVIYWDKITANFKQIRLDFKDKFQKK